MSALYLLSIGISAAGILTLDWRYKLAFFHAPLRAAVTVVVGIVVFLAWDVIAIMRGFYFLGSSPYMTGFEVAPELPIEEIAFITFFCHLTLVCYRGALVWRERRRDSRPAGAAP